MKIKQDINIGNNIRQLRLATNFTQEQVVARMQLLGLSHMTRSIYSQIEGGTYNIRVTELVALKQIFGCSSYDDFFTGL